MGNATLLFFELAGANLLDKEVKLKMRDQAQGKPMPGVYDTRLAPSLLERNSNFIAIIQM